jgi:predicted nuclease with TOPRIM domain
LIRIKSALESFIAEVDVRLKHINEERHMMCKEIETLKCDTQTLKMNYALLSQNFEHLKETMDDDRKDMNEKLDSNKRTIEEWVAIAAVIATIVGVMIGFFIPG